MNKRNIGAQKELIAKEYLEKKGYRIVHMNFYCRTGEIDLIAYDKEYLVFIEVKYRKRLSNGYPIEAIDVRKIKKITRTALFYITYIIKKEDVPMRFDVVHILDEEIDHTTNCFDGML